jgi:hypothetical protein
MQSSMRRWALNLAAAASAAVLLLALVGMVRSLFVGDFWFRQAEQPGPLGTLVTTEHHIRSFNGSFGFRIYNLDYGPAAMELPQRVTWRYQTERVDEGARRLFGAYELECEGPPTALGRPISLTIPWWFIALLASVLPAWWVSRWRRRGGWCAAAGLKLLRGHDKKI